MAQCVNCGEEAARPVWAIYADEAFKDKRQVPFALHQRCFNASETITASEWVPVDEGDDPDDPRSDRPDWERRAMRSWDQKLQHTDVARYRRVEAP
jgi:hypothetical protein